MNLNTINMELVTGCLKGLSIPERSQLFALAPVESPLEQRESLISLLVRTSSAHSLNPRRLIAGVLGKTAPQVATLVYPSFFNRLAGTINGHGKYANLFVQVLEKMTGQDGLSRLTLLPWKSLFPHNGQGMLSRHPRWCSACLLEQRRSREDTYLPLLWSLETYKRCTIHEQLLDDRCPHCGKRQPFLPRYPDLAVCHHCLLSLIRLPVSEVRDSGPTVSQFEMWVAKSLGEMVAQHGTVGFTPSADQFHTAVKSIVETTTGGNRAAFCRAIGFNEHALKNWLNKGERPSLTHFLALGYAVQLPPAELATGNTNSLIRDPTRVRRPEKLKTRRGRQDVGSRCRERLRRWLEEVREAEPFQPVTALAKRQGITARYLRYWFPDAYRELTTRYKESLRQKSAKRLEDQVRRVREIVRELRENGCSPSRRRVDTSLRKTGVSLGKRILFNTYRSALEA